MTDKDQGAQKVKTCGKCGSKIPQPGPCPTCNDQPCGPNVGWSERAKETRTTRQTLESRWQAWRALSATAKKLVASYPPNSWVAGSIKQLIQECEEHEAKLLELLASMQPTESYKMSNSRYIGG